MSAVVSARSRHPLTASELVPEKFIVEPSTLSRPDDPNEDPTIESADLDGPAANLFTAGLDAAGALIGELWGDAETFDVAISGQTDEPAGVSIQLVRAQVAELA